jgi:hypothetical protein
VALGLSAVGLLALLAWPARATPVAPEAAAAPERAAAPGPAAVPALQGTPTPVPDTCERWAVYAACAESSGPCYDRALHLAAYQATVTGGLHSNSGLRDATSFLSLSPPLAEWGLPGICTGGICPPGGPAVQVAPRPLPVLYQWADFLPGGLWWDEMCQGAAAERCHLRPSLGSGDVISSGLWVVNGSVDNPQLTAGDTAYTFVAAGSVAFTTGGVPAFTPFVGSSGRGGSRALVFALGSRVEIVASTVSWHGTIYAPDALVYLGASGTLTGNGGVFAAQAEFPAASLVLAQSAAECPPQLPGTLTPAPTASATPALTALPTATLTVAPTLTPTLTPALTPTLTPTQTPAGQPGWELFLPVLLR